MLVDIDEDVIEKLAALEHEQWIKWSQEVGTEVSAKRKARWSKYWVPYAELTEEVKEHDRVWARKVAKIIKHNAVIK